MNAEQLRCQNDLSLFNALLEQRDVKKVNDHLAKQAEEGPTGIRRQLSDIGTFEPQHGRRRL